IYHPINNQILNLKTSFKEIKTASKSNKSTFLKFYIFHIMKLFALIWSSIFFCEEDLDSLQKHSVL
ncbi:hypothetical protein, partial [Vibrio parahaemolyticus]|uniref:hypothetical protein n=1 Tax=Vibrio parahaemolyticus TaxID=670 RepID=UPI001D14F4AB